MTVREAIDLANDVVKGLIAANTLADCRPVRCQRFYDFDEETRQVSEDRLTVVFEFRDYEEHDVRYCYFEVDPESGDVTPFESL